VVDARITGARASYPSSATGTSATTRPSHSTRTDVGILRAARESDRARGNLDRHGVHFLTAYVAGA
jgi:hypothetical protein